MKGNSGLFARSSNWWKPLTEPLSVPMRRRLEILLAVVVTGAAIVVMSRVVRPDPSKLAEKSMMIAATPYPALRREMPYLRPESAPPPPVPPEFATAVERGDLETMEKLYTPGIPLDRLLFTAAQAGNKDTVAWLLDHDADVFQAEEGPDDPILVADAFPEVVALLVERRKREPSLTAAAGAGAVNAVTRLLARKVDVDPNERLSPLVEALQSRIATTENRRQIVEKLLAAGASPNRRSLDSGEDDGRSLGLHPLTAAVRVCDVPGEDRYPINSCLSLIKLLVARGARVTSDTLTAAMSFDDSEVDEIVDAVLLARVEPGATAAALSAMRSDTPPRVIKKVLAKGVDWGWHEGEDDAALPLVSAIQRTDRVAAQLFLEAGAPPDRHFKNGKSAIAEAFDLLTGNSDEYDRLIELLLAHGADVNRRLPDGRTPLFAAAEAGDIRIIDALLDRGARINEIVLDDTALDAAEQHAQTSAARVLHSRGGKRAPKNSPPGWDGR